MTASEIVLTVTLLAVLWYSWETRKLRIQSEKHTELSLKPQLEIVFQRAHFRLYNIGNGPAVHVRIEDKIVSPARYPERLRFICPSIIRKDECLPIEVKILTEDGKQVDEMARLGFLTPPEANETIEIDVHYDNLIGREYAYILKLGKDMSINSDPVDFLLQYLYENQSRNIPSPAGIPSYYVDSKERMKLLRYCIDRGLASAVPIETDQEGIVEYHDLRITSGGIDYLKG